MAGIEKIAICLLHAVLLLGLSGAGARAGDFRRQAEERYTAAKEDHARRPLSESAAVKFAEAAFDWADFAERSADRAALAEEGIAAMRALLLREPRSPAGHYYLALNMGQLARTRTLGALPLVREMERAFNRSIELDPHYNRAGAHRSLGMLYREAPGWPASIGSRVKARRHLEKAVELAPGYPENHLALLEGYLHWGERRALAAALERYLKMLPEARKEFFGEAWEEDWLDWEARLRRIQAEIDRAEG